MYSNFQIFQKNLKYPLYSAHRMYSLYSLHRMYSLYVLPIFSTWDLLLILNVDFCSSYSLSMHCFIGVPGSWFSVCHPNLTRQERMCIKKTCLCRGVRSWTCFVASFVKKIFVHNFAIFLLWVVFKTWYYVPFQCPAIICGAWIHLVLV